MNARPTTGGERGFSLIEVIIAVVILAVVIGAGTLVYGSTTRSMTQSKAQEQHQQLVSSVLQEFSADRSWATDELSDNCMGGCTCRLDASGPRTTVALPAGYQPASPPITPATQPAPSIGCDWAITTIDGDFEDDATINVLVDQDNAVYYVADLSVQGFDESNDGTGTADADGNVPDVFRLRLTLYAVAPDGARLRASTTSEIGMATNARSGRLVLRACTVWPQIDETMGTGVCGQNGISTSIDRNVMLPVTPPPGCPINAACPDTSNPERAAWNDLVQAQAVSGHMFTSSYILRIPNLTFQLRGPLEESPVATQSITLDSTGQLELNDLPPGTYDLEQPAQATLDAVRFGLPGQGNPAGAGASATPGVSPWRSHSVPTGKRLVIAAGETTLSAQLYSVKSSPAVIQLRTSNTSNPAHGTWGADVPGWKRDVYVKLLPLPATRVPLTSGTGTVPTANDGWTKVPAGATSVTIPAEQLRTGAYRIEMIQFPGDKTITAERFDAPKPAGAAPTPLNYKFLWTCRDVCAGGGGLAGFAPGEGFLGFVPIALRQMWCDPGTEASPAFGTRWWYIVNNRPSWAAGYQAYTLNGHSYAPCSQEQAQSGASQIGTGIS